MRPRPSRLRLKRLKHPAETIRALVARLDLERYKATIKGLTQFGDRLNGTDRNRAAIDWIETQLKSYGCATERFAYEYPPPEARPSAPPPPLPSVNDPPRAVGGGRPRGVRRADHAEQRSGCAN